MVVVGHFDAAEVSEKGSLVLQDQLGVSVTEFRSFKCFTGHLFQFLEPAFWLRDTNQVGAAELGGLHDVFGHGQGGQKVTVVDIVVG